MVMCVCVREGSMSERSVKIKLGLVFIVEYINNDTYSLFKNESWPMDQFKRCNEPSGGFFDTTV